MANKRPPLQTTIRNYKGDKRPFVGLAWFDPAHTRATRACGTYFDALIALDILILDMTATAGTEGHEDPGTGSHGQRG